MLPVPVHDHYSVLFWQPIDRLRQPFNSEGFGPLHYWGGRLCAGRQARFAACQLPPALGKTQRVMAIDGAQPVAERGGIAKFMQVLKSLTEGILCHVLRIGLEAENRQGLLTRSARKRSKSCQKYSEETPSGPLRMAISASIIMAVVGM